MTLETYGYKMAGIKRAAGVLKELAEVYFIHDDAEIFYNPKRGEVYAVYHCPQCGIAPIWNRAPAGFERVIDTTHKMSMQEIADEIAEYMKRRGAEI